MNPNLPRWPDNLPQEPFGETPPKYTAQSSTLRTSMESGPVKLRRRFTGRIYDVAFSPMQLTAQQLQALEDFVCDVLHETGRFVWTDFRVNRPGMYRLKNGWSSVSSEWFGTDESSGVEYWTVTVELEMFAA